MILEKKILFDPEINTELDIYYKGEEGIKSVKAEEITCANTV